MYFLKNTDDFWTGQLPISLFLFIILHFWHRLLRKWRRLARLLNGFKWVASFWKIFLDNAQYLSFRAFQQLRDLSSIGLPLGILHKSAPSIRNIGDAAWDCFLRVSSQVGSEERFDFLGSRQTVQDSDLLCKHLLFSEGLHRCHTCSAVLAACSSIGDAVPHAGSNAHFCHRYASNVSLQAYFHFYRLWIHLKNFALHATRCGNRSRKSQPIKCKLYGWHGCLLVVAITFLCLLQLLSPYSEIWSCKCTCSRKKHIIHCKKPANNTTVRVELCADSEGNSIPNNHTVLFAKPEAITRRRIDKLKKPKVCQTPSLARSLFFKMKNGTAWCLFIHTSSSDFITIVYL